MCPFHNKKELISLREGCLEDDELIEHDEERVQLLDIV